MSFGDPQRPLKAPARQPGLGHATQSLDRGCGLGPPLNNRLGPAASTDTLDRVSFRCSRPSQPSGGTRHWPLQTLGGNPRKYCYSRKKSPSPPSPDRLQQSHTPPCLDRAKEGPLKAAVTRPNAFKPSRLYALLRHFHPQTSSRIPSLDWLVDGIGFSCVTFAAKCL